MDTAARFDAIVVGPVPLPTEIKRWTVNRSTLYRCVGKPVSTPFFLTRMVSADKVSRLTTIPLLSMVRPLISRLQCGQVGGGPLAEGGSEQGASVAGLGGVAALAAEVPAGA